MKKLTFIYDNWCPRCTRFARFVKAIDWFNWLKPVELRPLNSTQFIELDKSLATKEMASYAQGKWHYGFVSIFHIALRTPIFWLICPIIAVFHYTGIGELLYKKLAVERSVIPLHCQEESCDFSGKS